MIMSIFPWLFYILWFVFLAWLSRCVDKTSNQRLQFMLDNYVRSFRKFQNINEVMTFNRHLWLLITLRDPRPAYADYAYGGDYKD